MIIGGIPWHKAALAETRKGEEIIQLGDEPAASIAIALPDLLDLLVVTLPNILRGMALPKHMFLRVFGSTAAFTRAGRGLSQSGLKKEGHECEYYLLISSAGDRVRERERH